jgi:8-amino-7-oxononanoate synthase
MAIDSFGTGACSSRPLAGTTSLHVQLEKELSDFKGTEATLLFSTGYMTMMGTISALAGEDDIIFSDQLNHASIIDGIRLSRAQVKIYKHNDMTSLEENLADSDSEANKLIVTDGVFSMMGDVANLPEIKKLADKYNAFVMVDDAHGTGVLGKSGRGILELYNMENQIEIAGSTFSKVFGTVGGAIGARKEIIDFLRFNSRPFIFTASLPPSVIATVLASLRLLRSSPQLLKRLRKNVKFVRENLTGLNFRLAPTQTPIIPLLIGDDVKTMRMATELEEEGVFVNPVIPPAVSVEASLIRISVMASLSQEELEFAVGKFKIIGKRIGLI